MKLDVWPGMEGAYSRRGGADLTLGALLGGAMGSGRGWRTTAGGEGST